MKFFKTKKAQLTIFIIVAIVLLIIVAIAIYLSEVTSFVRSSEVPPEFLPIQAYVEECIEIVALRGIDILSSQGGYIYIPSQIARNRRTHLSIANGALKIPYWNYQGIYAIPSNSFVEDEISKYVEENIGECIQVMYDSDFFREKFNINPRSEASAETFLNNEDTTVRINLQIQVEEKSTGELVGLEEFQAKLNIRLRKMLNLGSMIVEAERRDLFLENITIDLMAMNKDIPFTGITFSCNRPRWYIKDIKEQIQTTMYYHIPKIRFRNTKYEPFLADDEVYEYYGGYNLGDIYYGNLPRGTPPEDAYDYFNFLIDANLPPSEDFSVGLMYLPEWGMNVHSRPSEGGVMYANYMQGNIEFLRFLCVNFYHFTYDVVYPVKFTVYDTKSLDGQGYAFDFAIPVQIMRNQGDRGALANTIFEPLPQYYDYCDITGDSAVDIRARGIDEFGMYNFLREVNITYDCLKFICDLGVIEYDLVSQTYRLMAELPDACYGGFLQAEKEGYLDSRKQIFDETEIILEMKKLKEFDFEVVKHTYYSNSQELGPAEPLSDWQNVSISISYSEDDSNLHQYALFPIQTAEDDGTEHTSTSKISLVMDDATYKLDMFLHRRTGIIGGYTGNWTVSAEELAGASKIIFHVFEYNPIPIGDSFFENANFYNYLMSDNYVEALRPEII